MENITREQVEHIQAMAMQTHKACEYKKHTVVLQRIRNIRLYLNRHEPQIEQINRLLDEIEQIVS
jgi:hypothetical protein